MTDTCLSVLYWHLPVVQLLTCACMFRTCVCVSWWQMYVVYFDVFLCVVVCWHTSHVRLPTGWILINLVLKLFFRKYVEKFQVSWKSDKNNGTLHEDIFTFVTISRGILLRKRNILDKSCRENYNTLFLFISLFPKIVAVYEKNVIEPERPQMTIQGTFALNAVKLRQETYNM